MFRRQLLTALISLASVSAVLALPARAGEAKKKGGGPGYTQFPMLSVFTQSSGYRHGTLSVDMGLYTPDLKLAAQIKTYMPRLQDAYVSRLQTYAVTLNAQSLVDSDYVSMQLQTATNQVLGRNDAKVLLGSILLN